MANKGNNGQVMRKLGGCQFKTFTVSALNATLPSWSKICVWGKKKGIKKGFLLNIGILTVPKV